MGPIHPTIFRLGKTSRWNTNYWSGNKPANLDAATIKSILQSYLGSIYNLFIVNCGITDNPNSGVINVSVVFYKYIQRARMTKNRQMVLLLAAGAVASKTPIYHVRLAQGFIIPSLMISSVENLLQSIFGKPFHIDFFNIAQLVEKSYSKANADLTQSIAYFLQGKQKALAKSKGKRAGPPHESAREKTWLNPLTLRDMYRPYKTFSNLSYFLDILLILVYSSVYSSSDLLADVIARGLLRNMKRHKKFLSAISVAISHFRSFKNWPYKPFDWVIGLHGKIGTGTSRSRSIYIKTGFLPIQTMKLPISYTYRVVDTKFGSIGIKIWLRSHVL